MLFFDRVVPKKLKGGRFFLGHSVVYKLLSGHTTTRAGSMAPPGLLKWPVTEKIRQNISAFVSLMHYKLFAVYFVNHTRVAA